MSIYGGGQSQWLLLSGKCFLGEPALTFFQKQLVREIAEAARVYTDHNILLDLREATIVLSSTSDVVEIALYLAKQEALAGFTNKMCSLIRNEKTELSRARKMKTCLDIEGFQFNYFTEFEAAIEWLAHYPNSDE